MKIKTLLAVFAVALSPTLAFAECMGGHSPKISASSCAEGTVWDSATSTCVVRTTS